MATDLSSTFREVRAALEPLRDRSESARAALDLLERDLLPRSAGGDTYLVVGIVGPNNAGKSALFNALIGRDLSPSMPTGGATRRLVGALHPDVEFALDVDGACWVFELDTEKLLSYCPSQLLFTGLPRFPAVARDVAVVVAEDFASDRVVQFVRQWRPELVEDVALFDAYVGAPIPSGQKSLAYSISYRAADRTLTDEEVNDLHAQLVTALTRDLGVTLRQ